MKIKRFKEQGFTLLEVLFVLSIISIVLVLSAPLHVETLEKQQGRQFLNTFESDVLYIQNKSMNTGKTVDMVFRENHYSIRVGLRTEKQRSLPPGWEIDASAIPVLSFNSSGTIRWPGTIHFYSKHAAYDVVCPLGKGRCYIVEKT